MGQCEGAAQDQHKSGHGERAGKVSAGFGDDQGENEEAADRGVRHWVQGDQQDGQAGIDELAQLSGAVTNEPIVRMIITGAKPPHAPPRGARRG